MNNDAIVDILTRGVTNIIIKEELETLLRSGKKLRIKFGIDPTGPKLHLGRAVVLRKLRALQKLGHHIILIIGDFTGMIGDASDKDSERPMITKEVVIENMKRYKEQLSKVIDMDNVELRYNSEWLKDLTFYDICKLAQSFSVAEMLDRDTFMNRYKAGKRISLHEFMYPLMQGYDSVAIHSDVELGGNDQYFNVMAGRILQKDNNQRPQNIITTELILGTDGRKMSTSWGNTIYLEDTAEDMYGKIMSIPDDVMLSYFINCTDIPMSTIQGYMNALQKGTNPRDIKMILAHTIVSLYHTIEMADSAQEAFVKQFCNRETPDNIPIIPSLNTDMNAVDVLSTHMNKSKTEVKILIKQGALMVNCHNIKNEQFILEAHKTYIIQLGKRLWLKIKG